MADVPLINGVMYDYTSIELHLDGVHFPLVKEINYSLELSRAHVYGTFAQPVGRTRGQLKPDASLTLYRAAWNDLLTRFGKGYMEKVFDMVVTYAEENAPTVTDTLIGCTIVKPESANTSGSDPTEVKVGLHVIDILYNGLSAIAKSVTAGGGG